MLMSIRDRTHGWIATIIVSLLILSFALWGIHSYLVGGSADSTVAKVNGIEISKAQLNATYERLHRQMQIQLHSELSLSAEKSLKDRALQELIYTHILRQASFQQGYRIAPQQVDNFLESMPQFQIKGQFSLARFQQVMSMTSYSPAEFLDLIKTTLLIDQPRLGTIFTSFSLPNEVAAVVALVNQERDIQYATLPLQFLKQPIIISQDQIEAYYKQHTAEYQTSEQVSVEYIELSVASLEKNIHLTTQELKNYYDENSSSFALPTKNQKNAEIQPFEKVKEKVTAALTRQKAEEQFANVREKLANLTYEHPDSLKPAAQALGLSIKTSEPFVKNKAGKDIFANNKLREVAFSSDVLNFKNNSDVIQISPDSVIVMRIKSHTPSTLLALDAVKKEIVAHLQAAERNTQLQQLAIEIQKKLEVATDPEQIMQQYHLNWHSAGFVSRHSTKIDSAILDAAFSIPKPNDNQKISYAVTKILNGYAIIGIKAVKEGVLNNKDEYRVFAEQIQNTQGLLEYELYKNSLIKQAKVVVE
jgi:hypothetical protein